jgi:hypothetical protein
MVTPLQCRVLTYIRDEHRTVPEIVAALQIGADDATAELKVLEHLDVVCCARRLIDGKAVDRWTISWRRAERRK